MTRVGQEAPAFALPGAGAGRFDDHALPEYTDRGWTVVLVFYPFDVHPACTDQWCSLRDANWLTTLDDVVVLGVGTDGATATASTRPSTTSGSRVRDPSWRPRTADVRGRSGPRRPVRVGGRRPGGPADLEGLRKATNCRDGECAIEGTDEPA